MGEAAGIGRKLSKGYRAHKGCTQTTLSLTVECEQNTLILSTDKMNIISESGRRKRLNFTSKQ